MKLRKAILIAIIAIAAYIAGYYFLWPAIQPKPHYIVVVSEVSFSRNSQTADAFTSTVSDFARDMAQKYQLVTIRYLADENRGIFAAIVICQSEKIKQGK